MIKDSKGQVSLEYLLIFAISLIILIVFTLPLMENAMQTTLDVSDSLQVKSDLSKVSSAIMQVYGQGQGAKQTVKVNLNKPLVVNIKNNGISSKITLKDKSKKVIGVKCKSNLKTQSLSLKKGINVIVVEWPVGSENMGVYSKII